MIVNVDAGPNGNLCMTRGFRLLVGILLLAPLDRKDHIALAAQQYFRVRPQDTQVVEGQTAQLQCHIANLAGPVQWSKDGFVLGVMKYSMEEVERLMLPTRRSVVEALKHAARTHWPVDGVKGPTRIVYLPTLDLVWGVEPRLYKFHIVVVKDQLEIWLGRSGKPYNISSTIPNLEDRHSTITTPISFKRLIRGVSERTHWKSVEWKLWVLFYFVVCLGCSEGDFWTMRRF